MKLNLEYDILGSFLVDESTHVFIDTLTEQDFNDLFCKKLIKALKQLKEQSKDINIFNIEAISKIPLTNLLKVQSSVITTANIESKLRTLKEQSGRRQLNEKAKLMQEMLQDTTKSITEIKNDIIEQLHEIQEHSNNEVITLKESLFETYQEIENRYKNKDDKGYYVGLKKLDYTLAGLHPGELTTIAARPGVGKTIIGLQMGIAVALNGKKVLFTSLEMSHKQLGERVIAGGSSVDNNRIRTGNIEDLEDWNMIQKAISKYQIDNMLIDNSSLNIQHIRTKLRKYKPDLLIIDYLQLLHSINKEYSREREVAIITRDLKRMTQEFNIPIIMLSQLNRNAEGARPTMADLRESGAIEQDSDNIIFIHEPKEKEINSIIETGAYPVTYFEYLKKNKYNFVYIIIEKQRNGATGVIPAIKKPKYMKIEEVE